jgi:hypothetical protein
VSNIPANWQIDTSGLLISSHFHLSCQRYPLPSNGVLASPSPSFGILPIGVTRFRKADATRTGKLQLPVRSGEAFWLGLSNSQPSILLQIKVMVETVDRRSIDAISGENWDDLSSVGIIVPPGRDLDGIVRWSGGWWPFTRLNPYPDAPQCMAINIIVRQSLSQNDDRILTVRIELVDDINFAENTGLPLPPPLDPTSVYGGWLLP